jgi:ankyrin repeat protein
MSVTKCLPIQTLLELINNIIKETSDEATKILNSIFIELIEANIHIDAVKLLLSDPRVDPTYQNNRAICFSCEKGYVELVKLLLQDIRVDPRNTSIQSASTNNHVEIVELLLKHEKIDPRSGNNFAFNNACRFGYCKIVELFLKDSRTDPSGYCNYAIRIACEYGFVDVVELLLKDSRVDPTDMHNYALRHASKIGCSEIVKLLLEHPSVNASDNNNEAINWAFNKNHLDVVKLLIPKIDIKTITNSTILDIAKEMQKIEETSVPEDTLSPIDTPEPKNQSLEETVAEIIVKMKSYNITKIILDGEEVNLGYKYQIL